MECNYCKKTLRSKSSLYTHQRRAKYCLQIQGAVSSYNCKFCDKDFSDNRRLQQHKCQNKKYSDLETKYTILEAHYEQTQLQLRIYQHQVKDLQDQIASLASEAIRNAKPSVTNRTTYINMLTPMPPQERINQIIQDGFSRNYFIRGQIGLAEFINDSLVQDEDNMYYLVCSDTARQVFRFKDGLGNIIKDPCMKQFTNMIAEPVKLKTEEHLRTIENIDPLYIDRAREIAREFYKLNNDNSELSKAMSAIVPNQTMIQE